VAVTCLSGCAEIYYFSDFLVKAIPAISDEPVFLPILVWAAAVLLIGFAANKNRQQAAGTTSPEAPAYLRTLGLITYPLYLTHNLTGTAMIRVLTDAGLDATLAVWASLAMLVPVCWFICAKIEPAIRRLLKNVFANFRGFRRQPPSNRPAPLLGLLLPLPFRVNFTERQQPLDGAAVSGVLDVRALTTVAFRTRVPSNSRTIRSSE
jgi:peptidoglycan/LPS O-acetylase OafA/YrhL